VLTITWHLLQCYRESNERSENNQIKKELEMICFTCLGMAKRKCPVCKKIKPMDDIEKERLDYLLMTWYKLKKFNMKSTNCESLDLEVYREWGNWLTKEQPNVC
jgi:hypothetical protein